MSGIGDLDSSSERPKQVLERHPLRGRFRPALVRLRLCNRLTCWPQTARHSYFHQELLLMAMPISDLVSLPVAEPLALSTSSGRNTATWLWTSLDIPLGPSYLRTLSVWLSLVLRLPSAVTIQHLGHLLPPKGCSHYHLILTLPSAPSSFLDNMSLTRTKLGQGSHLLRSPSPHCPVSNGH